MKRCTATMGVVLAAVQAVVTAQEAEPIPTQEEMKAEMRRHFEEHQPKPSLGLTVNGVRVPIGYWDVIDSTVYDIDLDMFPTGEAH